MLESAKTYIDNNGKRVTIGGRIKDYSTSKPFVWSLVGDWYDEDTGAFIHYRRVNDVFEHYRLPVDSGSSISCHADIDSEGVTPIND